MDTNRRQFIRLKTRHPARVRFPNGSSLDAQICDFCPTGLFVHLPASTAEALVGPSLLESTVMVDFAADLDRTLRQFSVLGRVVHCAANGLGLFADTMSSEAFQALLDRRAELYRNRGDLPEAALDPMNLPTVHLQCQSLYRPFLKRVMDEFFSLVGGDDAEEVDGELPDDPFSSLQALFGRLRDRHAEIESRFTGTAMARADRGCGADDADGRNPGGLELALVDDGEFNDWLNLAVVINRVEAELQQPLVQFENRYRLLAARADHAGQPGELAQASPFSPDSVCRAFQEAIGEMALENRAREILYRQFGQALMLHGPAFYQNLARLTAAAERRQNRSGSMTRNLAGGPLAGKDAAQEALPDVRGSPPGASGGLVGTTQTLRQVIGQLSELLPGAEAPGALSRGTANTSGPSADTETLLEALSALLKTRQDARPAAWDPVLSEQLGPRLAESSGDAQGVSPQHQQILDNVAHLFDRVIGEFRPASQLETLIKRLEEPCLRLALRDPTFLTSDQHPARQLLDLLDQFAIAADDHGKFFDLKLYATLTSLVDNVVARAEQQPDLYGKAVEALRRMLQPLQKERRIRIQRIQEACEGRQRVVQARSRVLVELDSRLGGRLVPRLLLRLLEQGWRQYLCLLELRFGTHGDAWTSALTIIDTLHTWLSPGFLPPADFAAQVASLMRQVRQGLSSVCTDPQPVDALLQALERALSDAGKAPAPDVEQVMLEPGRLLGPRDEHPAGFPAELGLLRRLVLGGWWYLTLDGIGPTALQLVWLSEPARRCAFANRSGTRRYEFSLAELAGLEADNQAESTYDRTLPIIERSQGALIDALYRHLSQQNHQDPVTRLINRKGLRERLGRVGRESAGAGDPQTLGLIEFDQLRIIGHLHGPDAREAVLCQLAAEMQQRLQPTDVLAALENDTFAVWFPGCDTPGAQARLSDFIAWLKDFRFTRNHGSFSVSAGVGVVEFSPGSVPPEELLRQAAAACRRAIALGRNRIQTFSGEDDEVTDQDTILAWVGEIDRVLDTGQLFLRCQRITPLDPTDGRSSYYEVLLGVRDPQGRDISPQPLVQAAEYVNRADEIDLWVLTRVFDWVRANPDSFAAIGGLSVNLSTQSLHSDEIRALLHRELSHPDVPADRFLFEITETSSVKCYASAHGFIQEIGRYGCGFCLDDFGSGYASYGHLKSLKADVLKIDGVFIKDMLSSPADRAMVKSMAEIGHSLGMSVVAEYVGSFELIDALREIGVDYAQGYALHEPEPIECLVIGSLTEGLWGVSVPHDPSNPSGAHGHRVLN